MVVYQLYQFIEKVYYINVSSITNVSVSAVFRFRSTISMFPLNQNRRHKAVFSVGFIRYRTGFIYVNSHYLTSALTLPYRPAIVAITSTVDSLHTDFRLIANLPPSISL